MKFGFLQSEKLKKGSELSYDYGYEFDKDDYKDHICKCGSKNCIGYIISSNDWDKFLNILTKIIKNKKSNLILKLFFFVYQLDIPNFNEGVVSIICNCFSI